MEDSKRSRAQVTSDRLEENRPWVKCRGEISSTDPGEMTSLAEDGLSEAGRHHKNGVHPSFSGG